MEERPRPKKPPQIEPSERVYLGIDGTLVNARAQNRFMEAKVGIVFSHQLAVDRNQSTSVVKQTICRYATISASVQPATIYHGPRHGH